MTDSVYRKTPLPARLNLNDRNTRQQLMTGVSPEDNGRGSLEGVGPAASSSALQSQKNCTDVMRQDLRGWLGEHGIDGPPPSMEAEQRAMWQWIRDFHKEYNDDWFARNMPRVLEKFRPVFNDEMKKMKAERASTSAQPNGPAPGSGGDLLGFEEERPAASHTANAPAHSSGGDLLGFDEPATAPQPAAMVAPAAVADDLLSLDAAPPASAQAPAYSAVPAPTPAAALATQGGLDPLLMLSGPAQPPAPPPEATPAARPGGPTDLLGLFS